MTTYGAYSASQIYSPKEIKDLILYARLRGVKILPELDAPGWFLSKSLS
jgi:hexosaminidase